MKRVVSFRSFLLLVLLAATPFALPSYAAIGGRTAADGPFTIDDVEDLDLTSESLGRDWISNFVGGIGGGFVLRTMDLSGAGFLLALGQSPNGALWANIPTDGYGSINAGFGIPMPGEVGASTLESPGDIASFERFSFLACFEPLGLSNQIFQVLLECYPENGDGTFPTLIWNYAPSFGMTFTAVSIDLFEPDTISNNPNSRSAAQLLSQTRFLYFYFFASPVLPNVELNFYTDDIALIGHKASSVSAWLFY